MGSIGNILLGVLEQGLAYALMSLGIYITYKILDFPDLTVDGSFPLGAAVSVALLTRGINPFLTLLLSFAAGVVAGILTGIIHVKFKVRDLLSGIIMMTALYTVNLRIAGTANVPIFGMDTIFDNSIVNTIFGGFLSPYKTVIIAFLIVVVSKFLLDFYLNTRSGFLLRAAGENATVVTSLAKDSGFVKIVGLAIANGLVSLGGCVYSQQIRFFDASLGTGTMVIGLASVIIGTNLLKKVTFIKITTTVVIGSIVYKLCVAIAIACGLDSNDLKLVTAALFLLILIISMDRKKKVKKNA
ncbi:ABC transporter, permease protein [Lachnospiraceae bacterium KM106-2]|nr:ABC transporter, permease protein [Lachnospiraceae bacterium KM106-2]